MLGVSPSLSVAVAEHVKVSPVSTRLVLLRVTEVSCGFRFWSVAAAVEELVPPSPSSAVAMHFMTSVGLYVFVSSARVFPVPTLVPLWVHSKLKVGFPPSGSLAIPEQVSVLVL